MEAYSVLLADDEQLILDSLKKIVAWDEFNCYICGTATDGLQAKKMIETSHPKILIADIKMPGMTGLELAEYCAEKYPAMKVIIVSAYADFEFARKAMRTGTVDYLLKPISKEAFQGAIEKSIEEIRKEQAEARKSETAEHLKTLATDSLLFNLARYGKAGVQGELTDLVDNRANHAGVAIRLVFFNRKKNEEAPYSIGQAYYGTGLISGGFSPAYGSADEGLVMLCPLPSDISYTVGREKLINRLEVLQKKAPTQMGFHVVCMSSIYHNSEELQKCYQECKRISEQAFFCKEACVLTQEDISSAEEPAMPTKEFIQYISNGQNDEADRFLTVWGKYLYLKKDYQTTMSKMREWQRELSMFTRGIGMESSSLWLHHFDEENFEEKFRMLENAVHQIEGYIDNSRNPVGKAVLYIDAHYQEHDLSLEAIADAIQVNSSYLSRIFKRDKGVGFSDYLADIRIEKAKKLLEDTNRKTNEIAQLVGYEDAHYFGQVFKRRMGISPAEYRQKSRKITT